MHVDTSLKQKLNSKNITMIVGIDRTRVEMTGTIDGSNKAFTISAYPIYPKRGMGVTPQPDDVIVELYKGTTYTIATVASVDTVTDTETGDLVYGGVTLETAPSSGTADKVFITYVEALRPYVAQSLKIDVKQDSSETGELGSGQKTTTYAAQTITIDQDSIFSDFDVDKEILFEEYDGGYTVEDGYEASTMITEPAKRYVCIPLYTGAANDQDGTFIGCYYFIGKIVPTSLGDVKEGDTINRALQFAVDTTPILITPEPA